jgi:hypothetical protein
MCARSQHLLFGRALRHLYGFLERILRFGELLFVAQGNAQLGWEHVRVFTTRRQHCHRAISLPIFNYAKQHGYFDGENPVHGAAIPANGRDAAETYAYSLEEAEQMLRVLPDQQPASWLSPHSPG